MENQWKVSVCVYSSLKPSKYYRKKLLKMKSYTLKACTPNMNKN